MGVEDKHTIQDNSGWTECSVGSLLAAQSLELCVDFQSTVQFDDVNMN